MPIKITYAVIDVQGSRAKLLRRVIAGERIPFWISGYLDQPQNDDGTSREYAVEVTDFAVGGETQEEQ